MEDLRIRSNNRDYPIYIQKQLRFKFGNLLSYRDYSQIIVITDQQVAPLYLDDVVKTLGNMTNILTYVVPTGEQAKSLKVFKDIQQFLLENQVDRQSAIIALGGGVVGDLAGFVASTYMRGIRFIQMPTTLLAHDSSVGGKVAINLNGTKNILGNFYPPECVIYDTETLLTLNDQQLRSGFAEMVKHGFIADQSLLSDLKKNMKLSINTKVSSFENLLMRSIKIKQKVVEQDELENGIRQFLNFGHTLGHAIESYKHNGSLTHGECVMVGMLFALYLSEQVLKQDKVFITDELVHWLKALKYPLRIISKNDTEPLIKKMLNDKKNAYNRLNFVLIEEIGVPFIHPFTHQEIKKHLEHFIELDALKDV